jgi:diguanylate cyclase (GGDEF)-like protein
VSRDDEGKSRVISGVLALLAVIMTVAASVVVLPKVQWGPAIICAIVAGLLLEGFSVSVSTAGYFSMAAPVFFLLMSDGMIDPTEMKGLLPVFLGVSIAGLCSFARLLAPIPETTHYTMQTRLAGMGTNVLRTTLVGLAMVGTKKSDLGILVAAVVGYAAWLILDLILIGPIQSVVEDQEYVVTIWKKAPQTGRAVLALAPVAGLVGSGMIGKDVQSSVLSVFGVAVLGLVFRGTARYYIDEIVVEDQDELKKALNRSQYHERQYRRELEIKTGENTQLSEEVSSVYQMADSLGASTKVEDTVNVVYTMIKTLRIPFQSCVILLYKGSDLKPVLSETPYKDVLAMSHLLQLEETLIKDVVDTRKAKINPELSASSEGRIFKNERSVMCVPLLVGKETVGVIYIGSQKSNTHNEEHLKSLKMISSFASPSIKTAILFEDKAKEADDEAAKRKEVEAKNAQLAELQNMGQRMGATLKTSTTIEVVSSSLKKMIAQAQSVILFTPDQGQSGGHALKAEFADTPYEGYVNNLALRDDEGLLGKAVTLKKTVLVQDTEMYEVQNLLGSEHSVVVAPLISASEDGPGKADGGEQEVLGCLYVGAAKANALTEEHRNLIETVSYQTAMALKNARLYEQTQQQALTDGLTGLYTHRLFQEKLQEELEWADRHGQEVVLVMVDCDNFKTYNDTLGHPAGDALLKEVASLLKDKVRSTDIVCRYGGDEFALLLKQTRKDDALRMCERIREAFQLRFGGNEVQVTSSIGLACFPTDARTKKDLAKAADDALYVAKRGGRNMVAASGTLEERQRKPIVQEVLARPSLTG